MSIYKYNLVKNEGEKVNRPGYINVEPTDWSLDFCDPATTNEIDASKVLEYIDTNEVDNYLAEWTDKLVAGGSLILGSVDVLSLCQSVTTGQIDDKMFNILAHGDNKKINYSWKRLEEALTARGMDIDSIRYLNQHEYQIKAVKK